MVKELRMPFGSTSVKRCCGPIRTCSLDEQPREQKGHSASWLTLRRAEMRGLLGRQLEGDSISKVSAESASRNTSSSHWGASVCIHDPNHLNPGKRRIRGGWLKTVCSLKPMKKCLQLTAFFFFWQHFSFVLCSMNVTHLPSLLLNFLWRNWPGHQNHGSYSASVTWVLVLEAIPLSRFPLESHLNIVRSALNLK